MIMNIIMKLISCWPYMVHNCEYLHDVGILSWIVHPSIIMLTVVKGIGVSSIEVSSILSLPGEPLAKGYYY